MSAKKRKFIEDFSATLENAGKVRKIRYAETGWKEFIQIEGMIGSKVNLNVTGGSIEQMIIAIGMVLSGDNPGVIRDMIVNDQVNRLFDHQAVRESAMDITWNWKR